MKLVAGLSRRKRNFDQFSGMILDRIHPWRVTHKVMILLCALHNDLSFLGYDLGCRTRFPRRRCADWRCPHIRSKQGTPPKSCLM